MNQSSTAHQDRSPMQVAREAKGLTRTKWALMIGRTVQEVSNLEHGCYKTVPSSWHAAIDAAGVDSAKLAADYLAWRAQFQAVAHVG